MGTGPFRALGTAALDLLFPRRCPFCGRLSRGICPDCDAALPWTRESDGLREIGEPERGFSLPCAGALRYEGLAREGLLRMKFRGRSAAAGDLGGLIAQCAAERLGGLFDTVTWVPVSRRRLRKRGYDQAELLARSACRRWDTTPVPLLDKFRDNPAQSGIDDAARRQANVSGVYRLRRNPAGRRVLLIDDICTTGATLRSCAAVLLDGGAASVVCAVAALAGFGPGGNTGTATQSGNAGTATQSGNTGTATQSGNTGTATQSGNTGTGGQNGAAGTAAQRRTVGQPDSVRTTAGQAGRDRDTAGESGFSFPLFVRSGNQPGAFRV